MGLDKNVILMFCVWFEYGCGSSYAFIDNGISLQLKTKFRHVKVRTCEGPNLHMYQLFDLDY